MTRMAADSPAWPSSLKLGMNLVAGTKPVLSVQFTNGCFRTLNLKFSLDTDHSFLRYSPYLGRTLHWLKNLDCFALPFTKEGRDVITACVRVYTYKGSSWISGKHCLGRVAFNVRACSLFHVAPFQSQVFAMSKHQDKEISLSVSVSECITPSFLHACRAWRTIRVSASSSQRVSDHYVSASSRPTGLRLLHGSPCSSCRVCF